MRVNCVVACRNAAGFPDFYPCTVELTQAEYDEGDHYDRALERASETGFQQPMLTYDENDGPRWLFARFFPPAEGEALRNDALTKVHQLLLDLGRFGWLTRAADIDPDRINDACDAVEAAIL
jgi:hypothetical protein